MYFMYLALGMELSATTTTNVLKLSDGDWSQVGSAVLLLIFTFSPTSSQNPVNFGRAC